MFSKSCEYGIKSILYIASRSLEGERVKIDKVVENTGAPEAFTAKILTALIKHRILESKTGPDGGFRIDAKKMKEIMISQIVFAIDGDGIYNGCGLGLSECNDSRPCPLHHEFVKIRTQLKNMLETTTIYDLAAGLKSGKSILIR